MTNFKIIKLQKSHLKNRIYILILVITSCSYNFKTESYSLGEFITKTRTTTLGLEKSKLECINWSVLDINHYFTTTGDVEGCSDNGYIPKGLAYEECVAALGISID